MNLAEASALASKGAAGYVYLFCMGKYHKIGSTRTWRKRLKQLDTTPEPVVHVHHFPSANALVVEKALHRRFHPQRVRREWFSLTPEDVRLISGVKKCDSIDDLPNGLMPPKQPANADKAAWKRALGAHLRALRERAGLSQSQLVARAGGLTLDALQNWEQGRTTPAAQTAVELADALGVTVDELLRPPAGDEVPKKRGRPKKPAAEPPPDPPSEGQEKPKRGRKRKGGAA